MSPFIYYLHYLTAASSKLARLECCSFVSLSAWWAACAGMSCRLPLCCGGGGGWLVWLRSWRWEWRHAGKRWRSWSQSSPPSLQCPSCSVIGATQLLGWMCAGSILKAAVRHQNLLYWALVIAFKNEGTVWCPLWHLDNIVGLVFESSLTDETRRGELKSCQLCLLSRLIWAKQYWQETYTMRICSM